MKDREPQNIEDIEKALGYERRSRDWCSGIAGAGILGMFLIASNIGSEPSLLRSVLLLSPPSVVVGSMIMGLHRHDQVRYLSGLRDGYYKGQRSINPV